MLRLVSLLAQGDDHMRVLLAVFRCLTSCEAGSDEGQALAEYGMILALVAVVAITALTALGLGLSGTLDELTAAFG
jgi:Flp pilus assembly pilin Flp